MIPPEVRTVNITEMNEGQVVLVPRERSLIKRISRFVENLLIVPSPQDLSPSEIASIVESQRPSWFPKL